MKNELNRFIIQQKIEESLAIKLGIPSLRAGNITIRDDRSWRINEKQIEYCWLVNISRSFVGWCWLFTIRFNETKFRDINNPGELVQGVFSTDSNGAIGDYYRENRNLNFRDKIRELTVYDMFSANTKIVLDGVGYEYLIFAPNSEIRISLNNPSSNNWKIWEEAVWELGTELTEKSDSSQLRQMFK
jgi:hypothetical protein